MSVHTVQMIQKTTVKTAVVILQLAFLIACFAGLVLVVAVGMAFAS